MLQCGVGMRGKHSFVAGLLFSTRVVSGVAVSVSSVSVIFFVRVLFLVPVQLQCGVGMRCKHAFVAGLLFSTRIGEWVFVVWEWCFLPLFAGRFFSTRVMGGVVVVGVERVCDFCMRVLFLVPVRLRGACVCNVE